MPPAVSVSVALWPRVSLFDDGRVHARTIVHADADTDPATDPNAVIPIGTTPPRSATSGLATSPDGFGAILPALPAAAL
jgi:hypothetical protein